MMQVLEEKTEAGMTPEQFVYWLQGVFEVTDPKTLSTTQVKVIKDHLSLVLGKVTPNRAMPFSPFPGGNGGTDWSKALRPSGKGEDLRFFC